MTMYLVSHKGIEKSICPGTWTDANQSLVYGLQNARALFATLRNKPHNPLPYVAPAISREARAAIYAEQTRAAQFPKIAATPSGLTRATPIRNGTYYTCSE